VLHCFYSLGPRLHCAPKLYSDEVCSTICISDLCPLCLKCSCYFPCSFCIDVAQSFFSRDLKSQTMKYTTWNKNSECWTVWQTNAAFCSGSSWTVEYEHITHVWCGPLSFVNSLQLWTSGFWLYEQKSDCQAFIYFILFSLFGLVINTAVSWLFGCSYGLMYIYVCRICLFRLRFCFVSHLY
jgi:hypothetical protein